MSREWKPGDVAIAHDQDWEFVVVRHDGSPDYWSAADGEWPIGVSADLLNYRPLVVIDPEDREQVERLVAAYDGNRTSDAAPVMQAALRSLITPPKPDEPGTWGVVEASCVHSDHRRWWMHHADGNWYVVGEDTRNNPDDWDSLIDPVIVRDGVVTA